MSEIEKLYWEDATPDKFTRAGGKDTPFGTWIPGRKFSGALMPDCRHWRQRFELEKGLEVYASAWLDKPSTSEKPKKGRHDPEIDIGFYLDSRWASERLLVSPGLRLSLGRRVRRPSAIVFPWEDWGVPEDPTLFESLLAWLLGQIESGKAVEIGCMGGHGRTGTALACLLVQQGVEPRRAISRVRSDYCQEAVESRKQVEFVKSVAC